MNSIIQVTAYQKKKERKCHTGRYAMFVSSVFIDLYKRYLGHRVQIVHKVRVNHCKRYIR